MSARSTVIHGIAKNVYLNSNILLWVKMSKDWSSGKGMLELEKNFFSISSQKIRLRFSQFLGFQQLWQHVTNIDCRFYFKHRDKKYGNLTKALDETIIEVYKPDEYLNILSRLYLRLVIDGFGFFFFYWYLLSRYNVAKKVNFSLVEAAFIKICKKTMFPLVFEYSLHCINTRSLM